MKNGKFMNGVNRTLSKAGFQIKKHSPEILIVAGIAGVVTSAVMACKATTKINDILDQTKEEVGKVNDALANEKIPEDVYSKEDAKKDLAIIYIQTGVKLVKLYGPSLILGALSITSILASNNILRKRNVALAAAYATIDNSFKEYRGRVIERFGKDLDRELKYNIKAKEISETTVDENGKETTVTKTVPVVESEEPSDYARFFCEGCAGWTKDPEMNLVFLKQQQNWANELLKTRGHLFLNEVYDMLGIERSKAGQVVGWVYDETNPDCDNYVDFGIYDIYNERKRAFVNGWERSILLDFNVDGDIYSLLR